MTNTNNPIEPSFISRVKACIPVSQVFSGNANYKDVLCNKNKMATDFKKNISPQNFPLLIK